MMKFINIVIYMILIASAKALIIYGPNIHIDSVINTLKNAYVIEIISWFFLSIGLVNYPDYYDAYRKCAGSSREERLVDIEGELVPTIIEKQWQSGDHDAAKKKITLYAYIIIIFLYWYLYWHLYGSLMTVTVNSDPSSNI